MTPRLCEDIQNATIDADKLRSSRERLNAQRKSGQLCDVTFKCDGGDVKAHKCVLASVSDYFVALFTSSISSATTSNVVVLDDFSVEIVSLFMDVIYSSVDIAAEHVPELLQLAQYVQLEWVVDRLVEGIRYCINETNVFEWYSIAKGCGVDKLRFLCECYVRENIEKLNMQQFEQCFGSEVLNKINVWNVEHNRQVVISGNNLIDPTRKSITKIDGDAWADKGDLYTAFHYHNIFYIVTEDSTNNRENYSSSYFIWKFLQSSKSFDLILQFSAFELRNLLTDEETATIENLYVTEIIHDTKYYMYVMCYLACTLTNFSYSFHTAIFRFDLRTFSFDKGFVLSTEVSDMMTMAILQDHKICMISLEFVYYLDNHEFQLPAFNADNLPKTKLNDCIKNIDCGSFEELGDYFDVGDWDLCHFIGKEGNLYCNVDILQGGDVFFTLVLRLDVERSCWVMCCGRRVLRYSISFDAFHCGPTLFLLADQEIDNDTPEKLQEIFSLDENEGSLKIIHFQPQLRLQLYTKYVIAPFHIFI